MGGELFDIYSEKNLFGVHSYARFYIACVTLALEHMHQKRVIYRDLKLENCLLDAQGYVKVTDMGIAKMVLGKTYTICGTADYFAPETLRQTGHNRAVDWWACGVLLFIMCVGRSPFDAEDVTQIYKNIIKGFSKVKFPPDVTSDLSDVIKSLCRKKPEERVTMQKGGVESLKEMPWFTSLNWDKLAARELPGPLLPEPLNLSKIASKKLSRDFDMDVNAIQIWDGNIEGAFD
jgi:serine/threonine protein kinase